MGRKSFTQELKELAKAVRGWMSAGGGFMSTGSSKENALGRAGCCAGTAQPGQRNPRPTPQAPSRTISVQCRAAPPLDVSQ